MTRVLPMSASTVFARNRTQAVRLPAKLRFSDSIRKVEVRALGNERIIALARSSRIAKCSEPCCNTCLIPKSPSM